MRAIRAQLAAAVATGILCMAAAGCSSADVDPPVPTAAAAPSDFFGVVPQGLLTDEDLARMAQGNVGTLRIVIAWAAVDPTSAGGDLDFSTIDPVMLSAAANGIRIVPTIYGTPAWVAEDIDGYSCDPACGAFAPHSPKALAAWRGFIGEVVDRFGPHGELWADHPDLDPLPVRTWQIWNEQNSPTFYQPKVDPDSYAALLGVASDAIAERDPGAEVILGGMFGTPFNGDPPGATAWEFLRSLYSIDGARDDFDGVAAHPYAAHESRIELQVTMLHNEIARAGDDAGLWITEVGSSSDQGGNPLDRGPEGQAAQLRDAFNFFLAKREDWDIEAVTWYSWRDTSDPNQCDWCPRSGLFEEASLAPKPAWAAFVAFTGGS